MQAPFSFQHDVMGSLWGISIWDTQLSKPEHIQSDILGILQEFDVTYSRFKEQSLIETLSTAGTYTVPSDMIAMLQLYSQLNVATNGVINPLIGNTLSDLGYDAEYSLRSKETVANTPDFTTTITISDNNSITITQDVIIDIGAIGKGYCVDLITQYLRDQGLTHFLVNGSGDIYYSGPTPITVGLEDPEDSTKVIGTVPLHNQALAASAGNRRAWEDRHHIINPTTQTSPKSIAASWTIADTCALADGLATTLFLVSPQHLTGFAFEYCILKPERSIRTSPEFPIRL